ncbi:MAG: ABC transporter substrate-binding protein [Pseudonocardiaceae bacterium]
MLVLLVLAGCGQSAPATQAPATRDPATATHTVVDMTGRSVQIPTNLTRVATDYPALDATMLLLGDADRLVATSPGVGTLFQTLDLQFKNVAIPFDSTLTNVNVEALLATRPQVVLLSPGASVLLPTFQRIGIPALVFASFQNPTQLKAGVTLVADVLGGGAVVRAQQFATYYDANIAEVQARTVNISQASQPKVYYTAGNPLQTEGQNSIVDIWMNEGGGQNVAAENGINTAPAFATVTLENVLKWNPDIIVCRDVDTKRQIIADSRWSNVAAVRNHRVYINPQGVYVWSVRSAESALEPLWAAKTFHPDLFPNIDMANEVKKFYSQFYSYNLSDQQTNAILNPVSS